MDSELHNDLIERLGESDLSDAAVALVEACWSGDAALDEALGDEEGASAKPTMKRRTPAAAVFLSSIEVRGFRGIAESSQLVLDPGPGLTLVVGRNGSGKSSFAEAAEFALTSACSRWTGKSADWQKGWRNLHAKHATLIRCGFAVEGAGETTVNVRWQEDGELEGGVRTVEQSGESVEWAGLGCDGPLKTHRPFLSYAELGALVEKPSGLYDQLQGILGLEAVASGRKRLGTRKKEFAGEVKRCEDRRKELVAELSKSEDPRAADCRPLLEAKRPDLDGLGRLLTGVGEGAGAEVMRALQGLAQLRGPDVEEVGARSDAVRAALGEQTEANTKQAEHASALAKVIETALAFEPTSSCPVCESRLAETWREDAEARLAEARKLAQVLAEAERGLAEAVRGLRSLLRAPPLELSRPVDGVDLESLRTRWATWSKAPEQPGELADHAEQHVVELADAVALVRSRAAGQRDALVDTWGPIAEALTAWLVVARKAEPRRGRVSELKKAEGWMKGVEETLRDQRFAPIQKRAVELWEMMRQSSSVSLDTLALAGSATRRRVELEVSVDDQKCVALSVMSQGELNALALSLFLPRMEQPGSPFRFVVVDDPVQAMDLDKVDGLARVLASVAKTRQVVVFTHDARLPEAVERLRLPARVVGVHRRARSEVEAREDTQTSSRHFDDAFAVMKNEREVGRNVAAELVPAFCRDGIEAACRRRVQRERIGRGELHEEVARALGEVTGTQQLMALALFDDGAKGSEVYARVRKGGGQGGAGVAQGGEGWGARWVRRGAGWARSGGAEDCGVRGGGIVTPGERLEAAEGFLERPSAAMAGLWPRACAVLIRQALEGAVSEVLRVRLPGSQAANRRVQFLCLGRALGDRGRARELGYVWGRISEVLHQGAGGLPPSEVQLRGWLERARGLVVESSERHQSVSSTPGGPAAVEISDVPY